MCQEKALRSLYMLTTCLYFDNICPIPLKTKEKPMLQELNVQTVTLTPAASKAVQDILTERKLEGYALRVYVAGGGCNCSGVNFGMALDNNIQDIDTTFEAHGVKLVVDQTSIDYLRGATIDFVNDPEHGAGFAINSPSAMNSTSEESCGCGGSCSCNN
jgi:iron-sulfur cluster assembly protein